MLYLHIKKSPHLFNCTAVMLWLLSFVFPGIVSAQEEWGIPFIKNHTYKEYEGHTQNFAIDQNKDGIMFFGNFEGLLVYDGVEWNKIITEKNTKINSLKAEEDFLYIGGENEIGKIDLSDEEPSFLPLHTDLDIGTVQKILWYQKHLTFIAEKAILSLEGDKLKVLWESPNDTLQIQDAFLHQENLYLETGYNLWKFDNRLLHLTPKGKAMPNFLQTVAILNGSDHVHLVSEGYGIFRFRNDSIVRAPLFDNKALDNKAISCAIFTSKNEIILGSERHGIFRFSESGKLLESVAKKEGLQNNKIHALHQDHHGKIWASLNNGISLVDFYLPFRYLSSAVGLRGEIFGMTDFNGKKYFYGNQGVYIWKNKTFEILPEISTACWDIKPYNNSLLFATSNGVLLLNGNRREFISDRFTFSLWTDPEKNRVYTGELDGLGQLVPSKKKWKDLGIIHKTEKEVRALLKTDDQLWLDMRSEEIAKLDLSTGEFEHFNHKNSKLPELISYKANIVDNKLMVSTKEGVFTFSNKSFTQFHLLENGGADNKNISTIAQNKDEGIWFTNWNEMSLKHAIKHGETFRTDPNLHLNYLNDFAAWNIVPDRAGRIWLTGPEGVVSYNSYQPDSLPEFSPIIREVRIGEDSLLFQNSLSSDLSWPTYSFTYKNNTVLFKFGANNYQAKGTLYFQFWLEGDANSWSPWTKINEKEFTNLHYGSYTLKLRAKNVFGQVSETTTFQFEIRKPFSQSYWAYALYVLFTLSLIYIVIRWRINSLNKEKIHLENIIKERTEEVTVSKTEIELKSQLITDKNQELQRINQIVQAINAEIDFNNLLRSILERLKVVKGMDTAVVLQRDAEGLFKVDATWGFAKDKLSGLTLELETVEAMFLENSEEFFDELFVKEQIKIDAPDIMLSWNYPRSSITIVITIDSQIEGFLILTNHSSLAAFDERDQSLLKNLKEHLVSAFIKTSLLASVQQTNKQLSETNAIIVKQQEDIRGSIQYASRIQTAVMPTDDVLQNSLPDHFVLLRPRDIVSGDFYWLQRVGDIVLYAAADCTGHGVPGAFVSMLAISFLNEIVNNEGIIKPSEILEVLREKIKISLKQNDPGSEQKDGLDIALCSINRKTNELQYSGAYNSLYIIRDNELEEIKATRNPIAIFIREKPFENHIRQLQKGDVIYSFSDGYADQFGGEKGAKFYARRFRETLLGIHKKPMEEQKEILTKELDEWRGDIEQVDDVLVFGVRIS